VTVAGAVNDPGGARTTPLAGVAVGAGLRVGSGVVECVAGTPEVVGAGVWDVVGTAEVVGAAVVVGVPVGPALAGGMTNRVAEEAGKVRLIDEEATTSAWRTMWLRSAPL